MDERSNPALRISPNHQEDASSTDNLDNTDRATVHLINQSAKDYLLRSDPDPNIQLENFRIQKHAGNFTIARRCLDALQEDHIAALEMSDEFLLPGDHKEITMMTSAPITAYSVFHWFNHVEVMYEKELWKLLSHPFFQKGSQASDMWLAKCWRLQYNPVGSLRRRYDENQPKTFTCLHLTAFLGLCTLISSIISLTASADSPWSRSVLEDLDSQGNNAVSWAAARGHTDALKLLLDAGLNYDLQNYSGLKPLCRAAQKNLKSVVNLLLERRPDIEKARALELAIDLGYRMDEEVVMALLRAGATVTSQAMVTGCSRLSPMIVEHLCRNGAEVNASIESEEGTAMGVAVRRSTTEVLQILLARGVDVNMKNSQGHTPLAIASGVQTDITSTIRHIRLLLTHSPPADLESKSPDGQTALMIAVEKSGSRDQRVTRLLTLPGSQSHIRRRAIQDTRSPGEALRSIPCVGTAISHAGLVCQANTG
jgi:ankyrin repeat protein